MSNSSKGYLGAKQPPNTEQYQKLMDNIRGSVVAVLSREPMFSPLVANADLVTSITQSVFKGTFKYNGHRYVPKQTKAHEDMLSSILDVASHAVQEERTKKEIIKACKLIKEDGVDTITFDVIQASVVETLDKERSEQLDTFESRFRDLVADTVYAGSGFDIKKLPARKDLLYLDLILVAEGTNSNKDTILADELENSYLSLVGMPLVEEHIPDAIKGVFYSSELVRIKDTAVPGNVKLVEKGGKLAVRGRAYVFKYRFPREAAVIKDRQEKGLLRYSVELGFDKAQCSLCQKEFSKGEMYCDHLIMRHTVDGLATRIAKGIIFIGGAYTTSPAEKSAISISVTDPSDEKPNKKIVSSVITVGTKEELKEPADTSESNITTDPPVTIVATESTIDTKQTPSDLPAVPTIETSTASTDGGTMKFEFATVEELMGSEIFQTLLEAKLNDVMNAEREAFRASIEELTTSVEAKTTEIAKLQETVAANEAALTAANEKMAATAEEQRVTTVLADLLASGYKFESADAIETLKARIRNKGEEDTAFIVNLMKATVKEPEVVAAAAVGTAGKVEDPTIAASQAAGAVNASAETGVENSLAVARKKWDASVVVARAENK